MEKEALEKYSQKIKFYTYDGQAHNIIISTASATVSTDFYVTQGGSKEATLANIKTHLDNNLSLRDLKKLISPSDFGEKFKFILFKLSKN